MWKHMVIKDTFFLVIKNILTHISLLTNVGTRLSESEGF